MRWRYAYEQRDGAEPKRGNGLIQDVIAIIGPEGHLPLRVMYRMQGPPPAYAMLQAMAPVFAEIKDNDINEEGEQRNLMQKGENRFQRWGDKARIRQHPLKPALDGGQKNEGQQRKNA